MGNPKDNETRERIVAAARELFRTQGLDGVNMRELAEKAGVNKGLLHYYFKTKDSIFKEVFQHQAGLLYAAITHILEAQGPFESKVSAIVDRYFDLLGEMPSLPVFVLFEVQRDPRIIVDSPLREILMRVAGYLGPELKKRGLPPERADGIQFLLDLVSLCAFSFAMLPAISKALKLNKAQKTAFLHERKRHILAVLAASYRP
ncbi:MAG TPA: TetR/AcrR family transcriptional regulator [Flavobacteriales bacterium]|jgi:AcrR family transcriptional regulator|nr:TetR/AcrR family transcriptional regulator [Flavobacteriales bacterium]